METAGLEGLVPEGVSRVEAASTEDVSIDVFFL
jgi:hypothetical protein